VTPRKAVTPAIPEKHFMQQVRGLAKVLGYMEFHPYDSRKSTPGWPDCTFVHPVTGRLLFRELKTEKGRLTPPQKAWLEALRTAGQDADVWRPCDLESGRIQRELRPAVGS
jgi:hypothetical protein